MYIQYTHPDIFAYTCQCIKYLLKYTIFFYYYFFLYMYLQGDAHTKKKERKEGEKTYTEFISEAVYSNARM